MAVDIQHKLTGPLLAELIEIEMPTIMFTAGGEGHLQYQLRMGPLQRDIVIAALRAYTIKPEDVARERERAEMIRNMHLVDYRTLYTDLEAKLEAIAMEQS